MKNNILTTVLLLLISAASMSAQIYVPNTNNQLVYPVERYDIDQPEDTTNYEILPVERYRPNEPVDTTNYEVLLIDTTFRVLQKPKLKPTPVPVPVPVWSWEASPKDTVPSIIKSPFNQKP